MFHLLEGQSKSDGVQYKRFKNPECNDGYTGNQPRDKWKNSVYKDYGDPCDGQFRTLRLVDETGVTA